MLTHASYLVRRQRRADKFSRARKRREERRLALPPPDYPPLRIAGTLEKSITLRDHRTGRATVIELRVPLRGRSDQYAVVLNGVPWPKHGRAVGLSEIRKAISL